MIELLRDVEPSLERSAELATEQVNTHGLSRIMQLVKPRQFSVFKGVSV